MTPTTSSPLGWLLSLPPAKREEALRNLSPEAKRDLPWFWPLQARPNQLAPPGNWRVWLLLAGRGFGKTRTGAEWVKEQVRSGRGRRIALVAPTAADARDVMVDSLLSIYPPEARPLYESSKRRLSWPNGARATIYSAEDPDQLRGPNHDTAWADELAAWNRPETWDQLMLTLRRGQTRCVVTTTPRPIPSIKELLKREAGGQVAVTRGSTYDNRRNLSEAFFAQILERYEGTRLGRQELMAEVLEDVEGALWTIGQIDALRVSSAPADIDRVVLGIDPAVTSREDSDETGMVIAGIRHEDRHGYVLGDFSGRYSPGEWERRALDLCDAWRVDCIVAETNNGGDMVEHTIRSVLRADEAMPRFRAVHASRGKLTRAEPYAALYEQGRVHHVGILDRLEDQMAGWVPGAGSSPDRMDALVWALAELFPNHSTPIASTRKPEGW